MIEILKNIKEIILLAGAYISVCIGSGFATGQEILQFFTSHGSKSLLLGIVCLLIMSYCGAKLFKIGKTTNLKYSNDIFVYLFGNYTGSIFKVVIPVFSLCSFIVMISGAGATINEYFGINKTISCILIALISMVSVVMGINKVLEILGNIGPIIAVITISISLITIINNFENLNNINVTINYLNLNKPIDNWFLSSLIYSGLNIIFAAPFLVGIGKTIKNTRLCKYSGIIGGSILIISAMFINVALLSDLSNVYNKEIPTLYMAKEISPLVGNLFSVILIGGIYTTAVPLLWNVCSSCYIEKSKEFNIMVIGCTILGILGGHLPFSYLVNFMYPLSGSIGVLIILSIILKRR